METNIEVVCGSLMYEETSQSTNLLTLPVELLVYIMSLLVIQDRIRIRYVSRRLRCVSQVAALWSEFVWPYFESRHEHYVSDTLNACGDHVKQLRFLITMPSAKLVRMAKNCVHVTQLCLPPKVYLYPSQLEKVVSNMEHLEKLEVSWSEHIKPLLEICVGIKELTIRIKKLKSEPIAWELEDWANEGVCFPPVVNIFTWLERFRMGDLHRLLSKYYNVFPASELNLYSSSKIPINFHPQLPLLRFELGPAATRPLVKPSKYGILGMFNDTMDLLKFNYDSKIMYAALPIFYSGPQAKHLDLNFSTLSSVTFFSAGIHHDIFPGHLEQLSIACPNLQWLDLYRCGDCLRSLKGLQSIVNRCQNLQGLNIGDIPVRDVESQELLWRLISNIAKLTHLTLALCLVVIPIHVRRQRIAMLFQKCHNLQALEVQFGLCERCDIQSIDDLSLCHFPSLIYCKLSYKNSSILESIIKTCKNLKYLSYENYVTAISVPLSCSCKLQQLCIDSRLTDIPDFFMHMISWHGELEHMILCVRSISINGIYVLIRNSPNLTSFCVFINQPLCNENGRKLQSKDFKAKAKKEFCNHKLFTAGTFRVAVGNQFFSQYDVLTELDTDLNSLWSEVF